MTSVCFKKVVYGNLTLEFRKPYRFQIDKLTVEQDKLAGALGIGLEEPVYECVDKVFSVYMYSPDYYDLVDRLREWIAVAWTSFVKYPDIALTDSAKRMGDVLKELLQEKENSYE